MKNLILVLLLLISTMLIPTISIVLAQKESGGNTPVVPPSSKLYLKIKPLSNIPSLVPGYSKKLDEDNLSYYNSQNYHSSILQLPYDDGILGSDHPTSRAHWGLLKVNRPNNLDTYCLDNAYQTFVKDQSVGSESIWLGQGIGYSYVWATSGQAKGFYEVPNIDKTVINTVKLDLFTQCDWLVPNGESAPNGTYVKYSWKKIILPLEYSLFDSNQSGTSHSILLDNINYFESRNCYYKEEYGCQSGEISTPPTY